MECAFGLTGASPVPGARTLWLSVCIARRATGARSHPPGKDYVLLASDMSAGRSIIQMKSDENKIKALGPHLAMAFGGEPGDTNNFADYVDRNLRLFHIR